MITTSLPIDPDHGRLERSAREHARTLALDRSTFHNGRAHRGEPVVNDLIHARTNGGASAERHRAADEAVALPSPAEEHGRLGSSQAEDGAAQDGTARDDAAHDDATRDDTAQVDATQDGTARDDVTQDGAARNDAAQDDAARNDAARDDAARDDAARDDTAQSALAEWSQKRKDGRECGQAVGLDSRAAIRELRVGQRVSFPYKRRRYTGVVTKLGRTRVAVSYRIATGRDRDRVRLVHASLVTPVEVEGR